MEDSPRRSRRQRTANPRYSEDASKLLEALLDSDSETENATEITLPVNRTSPERPHASYGEPLSDVSFNDAQGNRISSDDPIEDEVSDEGFQRSRKAAKISKRTKRPSENPRNSSPRNRGRAEAPKLSKAWEVARALLGNNPSEEVRLSQKIELWFSIGVLPSRDQILQASRDAEDWMLGSWAWYNEGGGKEKFSELQALYEVPKAEEFLYYPPRHPVHKAVLGPYWQERLLHLALHKPLHLAETWRPAQTQHSHGAPGFADHAERNGWILNLGSKVQSISWAPIRDHEVQFLAIALDHPEPEQTPKHTAFEPSSAFKSCIQLWSFKARVDSAVSGTLDPQSPPLLVQTICTEWGMCKELKWCPYPQNATDDGQSLHLGLLASIWTDGHVRVLDVWVPKHPAGASLHVKCGRAAFSARPPDTICTVASWSSPTDIVVGCANGRIAAWSIPKSLEKRPTADRATNGGKLSSRLSSISTNPEGPMPRFYHQLHDTYILAAENCLPHYPWLLITLSTDGVYRMCDLRNPTFDTIESRRYRVYPSAFDYCPQLFGAITTDGYEDVNFLQIRHFFPELLMTSCNARVSAIACGRAHPCILVGLVDGRVLAFNAVPRIFKHKRQKQRWEMVWFKHEWRPESGIGSAEWAARYDDDGDTIQEDQSQSSDRAGSEGLRAGVSRITEAFKPYLKGHKPPTRSDDPTPDKTGGGRWETIFEEPSAITQLQWNPNPRYGGWAAAGMGSGLLRVEDLAI